jgi:hypothetical protein
MQPDDMNSTPSDKDIGWQDVRRFLLDQSKQRLGQWAGRDLGGDINLFDKLVDVVGKADIKDGTVIKRLADAAVNEALQEKRPADSASLIASVQDLVKKVQTQKVNPQDLLYALNLVLLAGGSVKALVRKIPLQSLLELIRKGIDSGMSKRLIQELITIASERSQSAGKDGATYAVDKPKDSLMQAVVGVVAKEAFGEKRMDKAFDAVAGAARKATYGSAEEKESEGFMNDDFDEWDRRLAESSQRSRY